MLLDFALFAVALAVLAWSSHSVIKASIRLAKALGIAEFAVGYLIISIVTSIPEMMVSIMSAMSNRGGIVIGNVLGSNIVNILLVLGIVATFRGVKFKKTQLRDNAEILLLITGIPLIFLVKGGLNALEGQFLLATYIFYAFFVVKQRIKLGKVDHADKFEWRKLLVEVLGALILVVVSAHVVVDSGVAIAYALHMPDFIIAATMIAFGTSLPELAIAVNAIRKRHVGLALGDVLGSCVVNLTLILGSAAILGPLKADFTVFATTLFFLIGTNVLLTYLLIKHNGLKKVHGVMFLVLYFIFLMIEISMGIAV